MDQNDRNVLAMFTFFAQSRCSKINHLTKVQLAITEVLDGKFVEWLEPVTDEEHKASVG
jgi:hypothetical protein